MTRTAFKCSDGFRCWTYELWYGMTHKASASTWRHCWRFTIRQSMCYAGLHCPIKWTDDVSCTYQPPEPHFECEWCGFERLPYRAVFWEGPLSLPLVAWAWIRHPRFMWESRP